MSRKWHSSFNQQPSFENSAFKVGLNCIILKYSKFVFCVTAAVLTAAKLQCRQSRSHSNIIAHCTESFNVTLPHETTPYVTKHAS